MYPPVLHQAGILRELADVTIVDAGPQTNPFETASDVRRVRISEKSSTGVLAAAVRAVGMMRFRQAVSREMRCGCDVVIAFDPEAAAVVLDLANKYPARTCVVHMHEDLDLASWSGSRSNIRAIRKMLENVRRAAFVVSADSYRAKRLQEALGDRAVVKTVMNCPRLMTTLPESRLLPLMRQKLERDVPIVHYQGSVGPDHGLESIIKSMKLWPIPAILCVVGRGSESYVEGLRSLAVECGVQERVFFLGKVPYNQVMSFATGASIGMTLLDITRDNWRYAAGASNKRFEYAALGIPQVTNSGPGMDELFVDHGMALTADPNSPESLAERLGFYLMNPDARTQAGAKARAMHLSAYNYELEFAPVLESLGIA